MNLKDNDNLLQQILHDDTLTDEALNIIKMKINIQKAKYSIRSQKLTLTTQNNLLHPCLICTGRAYLSPTPRPAVGSRQAVMCHTTSREFHPNCRSDRAAPIV